MHILLRHRRHILQRMRRIAIQTLFIFRPYPLTSLSGFFFHRSFDFFTYHPAPFYLQRRFSKCFTMISSSSHGNPGSTSSHIFIQLVYFFGVLCSLTYAACYFPNGSDRNAEYGSEVYQPCNRSAEHSMCCRGTDHKCRSDGLCYDAWARLIWRESCTDPTWNSSACVKLCTSEAGNARQDAETVARINLC